MTRASSVYENCLPEDLLDLIDHTKRGVQRLYESTKRVERAMSRGKRRPHTYAQSCTTSSECSTEVESTDKRRSNGGEASPPSRGKYSTVERKRRKKSSHMEGSSDLLVSKPLDDGVLHRSHSRPHTKRRSGGREKQRDVAAGGRGPVHKSQRDQPLQPAVNGADFGESIGISTEDANLARGQQRCHPLMRYLNSNQHMSTTTGFSSSAAFNQVNGSSSFGKSWKDTLRSLISGEAPTSITEETTMPTAASRSGTPYTQKGEAVFCTAPPGHRSRSATAERREGTVELLQRQLKEKDRLHNEEMTQLRAEHRMELSRVRRAALDARQKTFDEVTSQLQSSSDVKMKLMQAEIESERKRGDATQKMLEEERVVVNRLRGELEDATSNAKALQKDVNIKAKLLTKLRENLENTQRELADCKEEIEKLCKKASEITRREKLAVSREKENQALVKEFEQRLEEQQKRSREEVGRLQDELRSMAEGYEKLINETSERLTALGKFEQKYRALKEQHRGEKKQYKEVSSETAALKAENKELERKLEGFQSELDTLRVQIARKEHEMREEKAKHSQVVDGIVQKLEEQQEAASREMTDLRKDARSFEERSARLQRTVESLERQLQEEQEHSKKLLLKLEESSRRHQEELAASRQSASSYQKQTEEIMSSLKRQLREKDAKLEVLAATASEPLQRLRKQLEDERSKRAHLEEQFNRYKHKAKLAQEAALREIRREQQRGSPAARSLPLVGVTAGNRLAGSYDGESVALSPPSALSASPAGTAAVADVSPVPTPKFFLPRREGGAAAADFKSPTKLSCGAAAVPQPLDRVQDRNAVTPPQYVGHRSGWDSVGSISNISCSSPLYSSRLGDLKSVDDSVMSSAEARLGAAADTLNRKPPPLAGENIDDCSVQHELVLHELHKCGAEVFKKITGNKDEFLARCTSAVRSASHHGADRERIAYHGNGLLD
ncbi:unnamed protein product [Trypanosoma congolense IL3000]|uniref:WGS project CAEQ00000000 data, annotated contig 1330 n=1 Tax=Trypanosoma congolense (strain IL3000) TaxID=1068625 RepID=F9W5J4_TRYCI|nr:unnamed protein product [Trypanosoma congolense IL3000]